MSKRRGDRTRPGLRAVLVPCDLTPSSDRVLARVALLPLAFEARLTLLHVVPSNMPVPAQRRAMRDARKALAEEARHLASTLPDDVQVVPVVSVGATAAEIASRSVETNAEIIVMGRRGGRSLRDSFLGSTAERVIRRSQKPVLVVRLRAHSPYRRPALAIDLDAAAGAALEQLLRVIPPPRPRVTVIHASEPPSRWLVYESLSDEDVRAYRDYYRDEALQRIRQLLLDVPEEDAPAWKIHVRVGTPRYVIKKAMESVDADLLVLGTHGHSGVAYVFLGTVAGDVLREAGCDVLVVPPAIERG